MDNLFLAWQKFSAGKKSRADVLSYERNLEENLFNLQQELVSQKYQHCPYAKFIIRDPKERCIHKAEVKDRIVHQAIFNVIEPIFERRFIFDSFSCRLGKGTHAASRRLQNFLRQASQNNTKTVYALKCDIKKFFDSVDQQILLNLLSRQIKDEKTLELVAHIINSFFKTPGKGLPLGNLTSQLFANIYLHEFDFFVKHLLKEKWYLRYCDDFIILSCLRQHLLNLIFTVKTFLDKQLKLSIHPDKISIRSWHQGIDFVGYVNLPYCIVLRTKTKRRIIKKVNVSNLSSYLGHCQHANTFRLKQLLQLKSYQKSFY